MLNLDPIYSLVVDMLRTLLIEEVSERVRTRLFRFPAGRNKGLPAVKLGLQARCRRRLNNHLHTESDEG